ncbi:MAG: hypothetical protein WD926_01400 [Patescibacteria group bacterium]
MGVATDGEGRKDPTVERAAERVVLMPPEYKELSGPVVFLGGPIQQTWDWQAEAIGHFDRLAPSLHVASPRREYLPGEFVYGDQVDWETHYLRRAGEDGVVMFWLAGYTEHDPERSYAQTSRAELFEWKVRHERDDVLLVVGIEEGFSGARYIRRRFGQDCPEVPILDSLADTCREAAGLVRVVEDH